MKSLSMAFLILLLSGCAAMNSQQTDTEQAKTRPTLYDQLGGQVGVANIVDNFINEIGNDDLVFAFFAESNVDRFREKMREHLCLVADGHCAYTGDSMIDVHANMGVTEAAFNRIVDLLVNAMTTEGVPHPVQNTLLARLAPMRSDVIYIQR